MTTTAAARTNLHVLVRLALLVLSAATLRGLLPNDGGGLLASLYLVVICTPMVAPAGGTRPYTVPVWGLLGGVAAGGLAAVAGFSPALWGLLGLLAAAQAMALLALASLLATPDSDGGLALRLGLAGTAVVLAGTPVWLAPLLEATGWTGAFAGLVAANPLLHLGSTLGIDALRTDWLYRHSPLGSYGHRYPGIAATLATTWVFATLSWAAAEYLRRRRRAH